MTNVPPGFYSVSVEAPGFKSFEVTHNKLDRNAIATVDAGMTVGAATETVQVSATAARLQSESAAIQDLVSREQIDMLELNGRNPIGLAGLVPGARGNTMALLTFGLSQGPANFNGSRNPENLITLDGAPATRTRSNGASLGAGPKGFGGGKRGGWPISRSSKRGDSPPLDEESRSAIDVASEA